jgi:hypothetical protein
MLAMANIGGHYLVDGTRFTYMPHVPAMLHVNREWCEEDRSVYLAFSRHHMAAYEAENRQTLDHLYRRLNLFQTYVAPSKKASNDVCNGFCRNQCAIYKLALDRSIRWHALLEVCELVNLFGVYTIEARSLRRSQVND